MLSLCYHNVNKESNNYKTYIVRFIYLIIYNEKISDIQYLFVHNQGFYVLTFKRRIMISLFSKFLNILKNVSGVSFIPLICIFVDHFSISIIYKVYLINTF